MEQAATLDWSVQNWKSEALCHRTTRSTLPWLALCVTYSPSHTNVPAKAAIPAQPAPPPPHAQRDQAHTSVNRRGKQAVAGKQCLFVQLPAQPLTDRDHQDTACSLPN